MTDDIDEIVRQLRHDYDVNTNNVLLRDRAADALERLKDEAAINETVIHGLRANRDDAEAEIERLKAERDGIWKYAQEHYARAEAAEKERDWLSQGYDELKAKC